MMTAVKVRWLHANESGLRRFDTFKIEREMTQFAPPARPAHHRDTICHRVLKPDQALAPLVGRGLVTHAAERERGADRILGGGGDGDADHWVAALQP